MKMVMQVSYAWLISFTSGPISSSSTDGVFPASLQFNDTQVPLEVRSFNQWAENSYFIHCEPTAAPPGDPSPFEARLS
jgi:hypothetical protein